jgi:hypothetical protein
VDIGKGLVGGGPANQRAVLRPVCAGFLPGDAEPLAARHIMLSGVAAGCPRESSLEILMSDNSGGGSTSFLAFIVGGLVVAVGVLAFLYFGLHVIGPKASSTTTTITAPSSTGGTTTNSTTTTTP